MMASNRPVGRGDVRSSRDERGGELAAEDDHCPLATQRIGQVEVGPSDSGAELSRHVLPQRRREDGVLGEPRVAAPGGRGEVRRDLKTAQEHRFPGRMQDLVLQMPAGRREQTPARRDRRPDLGRQLEGPSASSGTGVTSRSGCAGTGTAGGSGAGGPNGHPLPRVAPIERATAT